MLVEFHYDVDDSNFNKTHKTEQKVFHMKANGVRRGENRFLFLFPPFESKLPDMAGGSG